MAPTIIQSPTRLKSIDTVLHGHDLSRDTVMDIDPHYARRVLHQQYGAKELLTANAKTEKAALNKGKARIVFEELGFQGAPHTASGLVNTCGSAVTGPDGCTETCLYYSGFGVFDRTQKARIQRTKFLLEQPQLWLRLYLHESLLHQERVLKRNKLMVNDISWRPANRMNVLTDVKWEKHVPWIYEYLEDTMFLDYTKHPRRNTSIPNYVITHSAHPRRQSPAEVIEKAKHQPVAAIVPHHWHSVLLHEHPDVFKDAVEADTWMFDRQGVGLLKPLAPLTDDHGFVYDGLAFLQAARAQS